MRASFLILFGGISLGAMLMLLGQGVWRSVLRRTKAICARGQGSPARWWHTRWGRRTALVTASIVLSGLYASFALAQPTLQHLDPLVFVALQLSPGAPVALVLFRWTLRASTKEPIRQGLIGGVPLGVGVVCLALSLHAIGILPTAMLTALDGIVASLLAWLLFRQFPSVFTCLAMACALAGAGALWWMAPSHWQSDLVALMCGGCFTLYAFHVERTTAAQGDLREHLLPFLGGVLLSLAATALVCALCFGRWETVHTATGADWGMVLYCGLGTVLVPLVLSTLLLRFLSPVTWAFLAILEPLCSLVFASLVGTVPLGLVGWGGVSLLFLSILFQAHAGRPHATRPADPGETHGATISPVRLQRTEERNQGGAPDAERKNVQAPPAWAGRDGF
jgi:drug/metabolite transporter (DMT)-like permease